MTPAKSDAALLERLFAESGYPRLNVACGASSLVVSSADDTGAPRERFRLVAMPKQRYRVELVEKGRWRNARISGLLEAVVPELLKSGAAGPPQTSASNERLERLRAHRQVSEPQAPRKNGDRRARQGED